MGLRTIKIAHGWLAGLILLASTCVAQMQVGDNVRMNLSGNIGYGYNGELNQGNSSHSNGIDGNANLTGSYYNPNFLNFNLDPFYTRTAGSSVFGNLTNASGVTSNVNLFSGSRFPGTVSYNRVMNSTSQFGVPGSDIGLAQHTNTQGWAVGWSELVPGAPTLTANFAVNHDVNSILGVDGNNDVTNHTLNLLSTYKWRGYRTTGQYIHRTTDSDFTEAIEGLRPVHTNNSSNDFGATLQHPLPWAGSFGLSWNHLNYDYAYQDSYSSSNSGASTTVNANASFHPIDKLGVSFNGNYNSSLLGNIPGPLLDSSAVLNLKTLGTFRSELVGTDVFYQVCKYLNVHGDVNHLRQTFLGQTYEATQFYGTANFNFSHSILKGLSFSASVVDTAQQQSNTGVGFVGTLSYTRKFSGWEANGNLSYSQNVRTVESVYTTSSYTYLASLRRRLADRTFFMLGYSGAHSGITANSGTTSSAERAWVTFMHRGYSLNTFYNQSNGESVLTANGLVPVPTNLPPQIFGTNAITSYDSKGWGINAGATPIKRLTFSGGFSKSNGHTIDPTIRLATDNELINVVMQYRLRKVFLNGGYTHLRQGVGAEGTEPISVSTYYIEFSRWFNFF
ncbi:MAG TPA: hypothetical protein VMU05_20030 [Dongiaceae bacterium]|nr:hypothetical protein [Dongiaceae bacterium]